MQSCGLFRKTIPWAKEKNQMQSHGLFWEETIPWAKEKKQIQFYGLFRRTDLVGQKRIKEPITIPWAVQKNQSCGLKEKPKAIPWSVQKNNLVNQMEKQNAILWDVKKNQSREPKEKSETKWKESQTPKLPPCFIPPRYWPNTTGIFLLFIYFFHFAKSKEIISLSSFTSKRREPNPYGYFPLVDVTSQHQHNLSHHHLLSF